MSIHATHQRLHGDGVSLAADLWAPNPGAPRGSVLLLHGGGQTRHSWQRTGIRLSEHGWISVAVDARGHGDSDWAQDGDYSSAAHARDVLRMASELEGPIVLVGASMGGMAALTAQSMSPVLAEALILVDITPVAEPKGLEKITAFMTSGLSGFDSLQDAADAVAKYNPHRRRAPHPEGLRKNLRHRDGRWYWHWDPRLLSHRDHSPDRASVRERHARAAAKTITVPTLLIRGAQSDVVSKEGVADLLATIPTARHIDVSGAGHMVSGDDNDVLSEGLVAFLDEVVRP
ncbi:alpha/beta hydrolase [Rhodococcus sp. 14-2686-1-2]|nr:MULTISPECIES: alpha/beta hydrolase [unclassified Rhodococcus (in: high G+C Gram-positive bacteria)]OZE93174.1 alpha/beta hydrolase [Rhodococcus sp. 15-1189-1-1a]OZF08292.1 alpha/beta hydrolase [Rhodococcus sp. 14-2686-1-2]